LPGWGTNAGLWLRGGALDALAKVGPVTLLDLPGQPGRGGEWAPPPSGYTGWLERVLDGLELSTASLVGASLGGGIAVRGALAITGRIERLVLLAPAGFVPPLLGPAALRSLLMHRLAPSPVRTGRFVRECLLGPRQQVTPAVQSELERLLLRAVTEFRNRSRLPRLLSDDQLRSVAAPTLLVLGEDDPVFSATRTLRRARKVMTKVISVEVLPGHGHLLEVAPSALEAAARFLASGRR
jgi:pimeloyl-ACP methyl ester carboxylesterase